jgi:hypothetical protein
MYYEKLGAVWGHRAERQAHVSGRYNNIYETEYENVDRGEKVFLE